MSTPQASLVADDEFVGDEHHHAGPQNGLPSSEASDTQTDADTRDTSTNARRGRPRKAYTSLEQEKLQHHTLDASHGDLGNNPFNHAPQELPPLEGHEQTFVRYRIRGEEDWDNVRKYLARGFRPRTKDTLPQGFYVGSKKVEFDDTDFGNVVSNQDRILMTRPKKWGDAERAREKSLQQDIMGQVKANAEGLGGLGVHSGIESMEVGTFSDGGFHFPVGG